MSKDKREPAHKRAPEEDVEKANALPALPTDVIEKIGRVLEAERFESEASSVFFKRKDAQTARIKRKLLKFAADGKFDHVFNVLKIRPELDKAVLFALAGSAEQDKMQLILLEHPELLTEPGPLTDISGVQFESITVFQHAVWAGDVRYMANMMLDCIPNAEAGEQIRLKLVEHYKDLMVNGVCYQLNGQTYRETQFSLTPLIEALATYVKEFDNWDWPARENHWCKVVGGAQTRLPAHIRHHYCDPNESFYDAPDFRAVKLVRGLSFYNFVSNAPQLWCSSVSGLGSVFGIRRGGRHSGGVAPAGGRGSVGAAGAAADLAAITALCKMRTENDGLALKERLERPFQKPEENPKSRCVIF